MEIVFRDDTFTSGLLDFFFSDGEEAPADGYVPNDANLGLSEGLLPLNTDIFTGSVFTTVGKLKHRAPRITLSGDMKTDGSESGGFTLAKVPVKDIETVKDVLAEYYLRDIYGNELILTDAVAAADKEPMLKNLAFAEVNSEDGVITVNCGDAALDADLDYMVYSKDGEILIQGIGEYAGSIVLSEEN